MFRAVAQSRVVPWAWRVRQLASAAPNAPKTQKSSIGQFWARRSLMGKVMLGAGGCAAATLLYEPWRTDAYRLSNGILRFTKSVVTAGAIIWDYRRTFQRIERDNLPAAEADKEKSECHLRSAQRLLSLFQRNGGVYIKAGQHIAAMFLLLPMEYVDTMRPLQDAAPTQSKDAIDRLFQDELEDSPENIFSHFSPHPLAAASLAQVHYAVLRDGREVAVKVQYPNLRDEAHGDLMTISLLIRAAKFMFPDFEFMWLEREFRENLPNELDFTKEAHNSEKIAAMFEGSQPPLKVPAIHWPLTTKRILVMEFCHGRKVNDRQGLIEDGISPDAVAQSMSEVFSQMMFIHGFVHADPHPGNVLVQKQKNGRPLLVLLDHGLYRDLDEEFRLNYCHLWKALILRDIDEIQVYSRRLGVQEYQLFSSMLTARSWDDSSVGLGSERSTAEVQKLKDGAAQYFQTITQILGKVPKSIVLLLKTNDLLRAVNADLRTTTNPFLTMADYVAIALRQDALRRDASLSNRLHVWKEDFRVWLQLRFFRVYLFLSSVFGLFRIRRKGVAEVEAEREAVVVGASIA